MRELAVVGLPVRFQPWLERIGQQRGFRVRRLLTLEHVRFRPRYDIDGLLAEARDELTSRQPGSDRVDGITTFWDFPSSCIATTLAEERGLPGPGLRATVTFEHKYWSRLVQRELAPQDTPQFASLDVFDEWVVRDPPLAFPFWIKPVKSYSGHLGFRVGRHDELRAAIEQLRLRIPRLGTPFEVLLGRVPEIPDEVATMGGNAAIAEQILDGEQCTLEGHVHHGHVRIHGIFDIHRATDGSTFTHYTYPSARSEAACEQMRRIATDLMRRVGYDDGAFNIEFFVDEGSGRTWILEINPRISQEHSHLTEWVDGTSNLAIMAQTALGDEPVVEPRQGPCTVAAKFFVRRWQDGVVTHVPNATRVASIERSHAPCVIEVLVATGDRLSALRDQEPYSYLMGSVHLGGDDIDELHERFRSIVEQLELTVAAPAPVLPAVDQPLPQQTAGSASARRV